MSLLLGTIKNKFGFLRQFKDMSLSELDFSNEARDCQDYLFDDLDGDDEDFLLSESPVSLNSNDKRDDECAKIQDREVGPNQLNSLMEYSVSPTEKTLDSPMVDSSLSEADLETFTEKPALSQSSRSIQGTPEPVFVKAPPLLSDNDDETKAEDETKNAEDVRSMEEVFQELEAIYVEARSIVVRADGFISTPLHAMKMIGNRIPGGIPRKVTRYGKESFSRHLIRVEFKTKDFYGVGESFNERMAAQMAALDLLMREANNSAVNIAPFALYPGWRLRPRVTHDLMRLCKANGLKWPRLITKSNIGEPEKPVCLVECYIGKQFIARGESDLPFCARKLAAANAIEELAAQKYPLEHVAFGKACMTDEELEAEGYYLMIPDLDDIGSPVNQDDDHVARKVGKCKRVTFERNTYEEEMQDIKRNKLDLRVTVECGENQPASRTAELYQKKDN